jgi:hypothetical protein
VPELPDPVEHRKEAEVHAAHVQRAQFGLEAPRGRRALLERHPVAATGRDIDNHVARRADLGQNWANTSGSGVGRPSSGSRACRCTIAAPASAAPIAFSAIWLGVIGRCGVSDGTWIAPVMAQLMMTLLLTLADRLVAHDAPPNFLYMPYLLAIGFTENRELPWWAGEQHGSSRPRPLGTRTLQELTETRSILLPCRVPRIEP